MNTWDLEKVIISQALEITTQKNYVEMKDKEIAENMRDRKNVFSYIEKKYGHDALKELNWIASDKERLSEFLSEGEKNDK